MSNQNGYFVEINNSNNNGSVDLVLIFFIIYFKLFNSIITSVQCFLIAFLLLRAKLYQSFNFYINF